MSTCRHVGFLIFEVSKFWCVRGVKRVNMRQIAKFSGDRSDGFWGMTIFQLFEVSATAILEFQNLNLLTVSRVNRIDVRHGAKFHDDRWNHCLDIAVFRFLANVNSRSRSLYAIARPSVVCLSVVCLSSVVCNVRAPYSGGLNFRQYFYGIRYLGHPLTSTKNFTEIVPGEPVHRGSWTHEE